MPLPFILAAGLLLAADPAKNDHATLQGTWNVIGLEFDGDDVKDRVKNMQFVIKDHQVSVQGDYPDQDKYSKFTFKLDPAGKPKGFDAIITAGDEKGAKLPGIYQLEKDNLKICLRLLGKERPKEFATQSGSARVVVILERAK